MSPLTLVGMLLVAASSAVLGDVSHIVGSGGTPSQAAEINYNLASPQPRDFWWMDPNSPLKAAYDYYKKCAAKGNCLPPTAVGGEGQAPQSQAAVPHPQPFRPQPNPFAPQQQQQQIDINKNPFLNGQFQGITDKIPHHQQASQSPQGAQQGQAPLHIDISKNPFFNGVVTTGSGAPIPKGEGFLGVQPAQPFNNGNKKPFATTHPLDNKKPFATTHPLDPLVECRGSGKICVDKEACVNGVVNKNGEGILQVRSDVQYCDGNREVCCKLHLGETPKTQARSSFNDLSGITAGKSSVPGLIKFQGAAGLSPGSIQVILDDPQLKPSIYSVGESGSQHSSSSTPKTIRDVSPSSNSVFGSSTVDYSDTKFDDIVGASAFQGPAYLPPKGTPTPPRYNTPELEIPSVSTYQPSIPTRAPSSPRPFNTTPRPTPPPYTIPVIVSSPSAGTTFVSRQPSFPSTYLPPASSPRPFPTTQRVSSTYLPPTRPPPTRPPPTRPPPPPTTVREYLPPSSTPYYNNQYVTKPTPRPTYPSTPRPTTSREYLPPSSSSNNQYVTKTTPRPTYPSTPRPTYPSTPRPTYPSTPRQTYPSTPRPTTVREYLPPSSSNNINNQYVTKTTPRPVPRPTTSREYLPPFENPPSSPQPHPFTRPEYTPRQPLGPTPITFQPSPSSQRPQTQPPFRPQPSTPNYQYPSPSSQRPQTQPPFRPQPSTPNYQYPSPSSQRPQTPAPYRPQPSTPGYQYPSPSSQRPQTQPPFRPQPSTPGYQYPSPSSQRPQTQPPLRPQPSTPGYQYPSPSSQSPQTQPPFRPQPSTPGYQYPSPSSQRPQTQPPFRPQPSTPGYQYPSPTTQRPTQPPYRPQPSTNNGYQYPSPSTARPQTQPPYKPQPSTNNGYQYPTPSTSRPTQPPYRPQPSTNNGYQYPSPSTARPQTQPPYKPQPSTNNGYQYPSPSTPRPYSPQPSTPGYQYPSPSTARPQTRPPYQPQPSTNNGYQYPSPSTARPQTQPPYKPQPSPSTNSGYQYPRPSTQQPSPSPSNTRPSEYLPPATAPTSRPTYTPRVPQPGGHSTVYVPPATPSQPTGGYTYPKPTPTFGYPTPSTPPIGGESNNVNNNYLPPPKKPYTEPPYSPSEPPSYSSLPPSRPTQPPYSRPTPPPYSQPTPPPYSRPTPPPYSRPTQTYLPPTRPPTDNIPEPDTPTDVRLLPKSCAAALKCVQEIYCTADGLISPVPVVLTKEQEINRVPTTTCLEVQSGTIGKCCRDPNYVDPWPSANLVNGEDDGQYKEDDSFGKYTPDLNRIVRSDTESQRPSQTEQFQNPPPQQPECGARHSGTNPPGVGPLDVNFAEIPWQAMILRDSNRSLLCGGAIIRRNAVLTTAHCVQGLETSDVLVKGGEWKLGIDEEPLPFQIVKVSAIVRHPEYKHGSLINDLAILFLEEKLRPAKNIGTICLPPPNQIPTQNCIATGWGKRILQLHAKGAIMHAIDINVMDTNQCRDTLADQFQHALENYSPNTLCGYSNKDQCRVDHGSALACSPGANGQYTLSGIFAWDTGCKHKGQIGGYIAPDVEWIENSLAKPFNELKQLERNYVSRQQ